MASITITGVDQLIKKLGRVEGTEVLWAPMERSVLRLERDMATYPPSPSGSTYRRTGTLGRRWTTKVSRASGGLVGTVGNNTSYGPFVQSSRFQARHMQHWTNTDQNVLDKNRNTIVADFKRAIDEALK